jgi:type II secretory pathway pseudopilin PulG
MSGETLVVVAIVVAAVGFLGRNLLRARRLARERSAGCDHCGS